MARGVINFSICLLFIFLLNETLEAQLSKPGITLGGNLMYTKPKGNFAESYKSGGGGEVFGGVGFGKTYVVATAGLSKFNTQSGLHTGTLTYTPLKVGLKHFLFKKILFVNADIGKAIVKNRIFKESRFTRGFGVGAKLLSLEAALYYDGWKNVNARGFSNTLDFKVGWSLSL